MSEHILVIRNFPAGGEFSWYADAIKRAVGSDVEIEQVAL